MLLARPYRCSLTKTVNAVLWFHTQPTHTVTEMHIFCSHVVLAKPWFPQTEPSQSLSANNVPATTTVVPVRYPHVKPMPKIQRFFWVLVTQEIAKILYYDVCVVIRFHEPIKIVQVVLVQVVKCILKLRVPSPQQKKKQLVFDVPTMVLAVR